MLSIHSTKSYRKSYKKLLRSGTFDFNELEKVIEILISEKTLPPQYKDHPLSGKLIGLRDCHINFDLVLIYQLFPSEKILMLSAIGTHSELFH